MAIFPACSFQELPLELLYRIAARLETIEDLKHFARVNRTTWNIFKLILEKATENITAIRMALGKRQIDIYQIPELRIILPAAADEECDWLERQHSPQPGDYALTIQLSRRPFYMPLTPNCDPDNLTHLHIYLFQLLKPNDDNSHSCQFVNKLPPLINLTVALIKKCVVGAYNQTKQQGVALLPKAFKIDFPKLYISLKLLRTPLKHSTKDLIQNNFIANPSTSFIKKIIAAIR